MCIFPLIRDPVAISIFGCSPTNPSYRARILSADQCPFLAEAFHFRNEALIHTVAYWKLGADIIKNVRHCIGRTHQTLRAWIVELRLLNAHIAITRGLDTERRTIQRAVLIAVVVVLRYI